MCTFKDQRVDYGRLNNDHPPPPQPQVWPKGTRSWITNPDDGEIILDYLSEPNLNTGVLKSRDTLLAVVGERKRTDASQRDTM